MLAFFENVFFAIGSGIANAVNWRLIYNELPNLAQGAVNTLGITASAVAIGVVVGLVIAITRLSHRFWLRVPAMSYIEAFRGTPMLVQILLIYYGVFPGLQKFVDWAPGLFLYLEGLGLPPVDFTRLPAVYSGIIALGLNSGAYLGEIFRGGIQSIDKGQREAALSLGMTEYQVMRHVVLPQALANSLPAIGNEFVTLIKDSSLVSVIAVSELTYRAMLVAARRYEYFTMYVGIALLYFTMTFTTSRLLAVLEKRLRVGYR